MLAVELHKELRRRNITGDFILALIVSKYKSEDSPIDLSNYYNTRDLLLYGLEWRHTPQGYNFWYMTTYDKMY